MPLADTVINLLMPLIALLYVEKEKRLSISSRKVHSDYSKVIILITVATFIESLFCVGHCSSAFLYLSSFTPHLYTIDDDNPHVRAEITEAQSS